MNISHLLREIPLDVLKYARSGTLYITQLQALYFSPSQSGFCGNMLVRYHLRGVVMIYTYLAKNYKTLEGAAKADVLVVLELSTLTVSE